MTYVKPILLVAMVILGVFLGKSVIAPNPGGAVGGGGDTIRIDELHRHAPLDLPVVGADLS
jgi:hypothetical protein